jgi:hypothetical protein
MIDVFRKGSFLVYLKEGLRPFFFEDAGVASRKVG